MGLLITIAVLAILFLIALKLFTVKKVVVEGNELYDQKTIEDAVLNDKYSWNSLYVYLKYKIKDTKKIPFIDTMSISLDLSLIHISSAKAVAEAGGRKSAGRSAATACGERL